MTYRSVARALALILALAGTRQASAQRASSLTPALMRDDLAWFRREVFPLEHSYTPAARAEAERRLALLETAIDKTTPVAFELEIARIVALADNGHSSVNAIGRADRYNRVPIRLTTFGDEFRVMRASVAQADLLGARLVAIDGRPIAEVRDTGRMLAGGVPVWRDRNVPVFLESPEQLHALGVARAAGSAEYTFVTDVGKRVVRRIVADSAGSAGPGTRPDMLLYPQPAGGDESAWVSLHPTQIPWSLADPQIAFRWRVAPEIDGMVIQFRRVVDGPGQAIKQFFDTMTAKVTAERPRNVVIDMRLNGGGNLQNARDFMVALPGIVPGRIFVLTGPTTFSAAISSVGYLKQAAPDRVTIVGEEVGDRLVFFSEGQPAMAPNSKMMIGYATQRHDYMNGCKAFTDCHGPVVRFPIAVPTLRPEIAAPLTFAVWTAGRDVAMEAVVTALKR